MQHVQQKVLKIRHSAMNVTPSLTGVQQFPQPVTPSQLKQTASTHVKIVEKHSTTLTAKLSQAGRTSMAKITTSMLAVPPLTVHVTKTAKLKLTDTNTHLTVSFSKTLLGNTTAQASQHGGQANRLKAAQHTNPNGRQSTAKNTTSPISTLLLASFRLKSAQIKVTNITSSKKTLVFGWNTTLVFTKAHTKAKQAHTT